MMKAVFFDVDDTLYDQSLPFDQALKEVFPDEHFDVEATFQLFRKISDDIYEQYISGRWDLKKMRRFRIIETIKRSVKKECSAAEADRFQTAYTKALSEIQMIPEIEQTLADLHARQIPLGVITNGPAQHQKKKLEQLNVARFIPQKHWVISGMTPWEKPEKAIFEHARRLFPALRRDPAADFLYVGDSFENDVIGAKSAGWKVLWFNHRNRRPLTEKISPDWTLDTSRSLFAFSKTLNQSSTK